MSGSLTLRPGTNDQVIYDSVVVRNEYRLPARLPRGSVVIDIGAHAGLFSHVALTRGADTVYAFEPEPANLQAAQTNLAGFSDHVVLSSRAVWRSDVPVSSLHLWPSADAANTGGGTVIWETNGASVDAVSFDEVVDAALHRHKRPIDLVKIDCEGAEFPILLTSRRLGHINHIVGEYHELRGPLPAHASIPGHREFTLDALVEVLTRSGFIVEHVHQANGDFGALGLFFATRDRPLTRWGSLVRRWFRT